MSDRALGIVADLHSADAAADGRGPSSTSRAEPAGPRLAPSSCALASDGVFAEVSPGVFRNTDESELLRTGGDWRDFAHFFGTVWHRAAGELEAETGAPTFPRTYGTDFWAWLAAHPDERAAFDRAMVDGLGRRVERLAALEWRRDETVVDVGGGNGSLLVALLARRPELRGIVWPGPIATVDLASLHLRRRQLLRRPPGDVTSSRRSHDWPDEQAASFARSAPRGTDHGRLLGRRCDPAGERARRCQMLDLLDVALLRRPRA
jgi:hypothetical protein